MLTAKKIVGIHGSGSQHWVGDGFPVRNLFPSNGIDSEISPFLMLDYAGPTYFKPSETTHGVGEHPHRGFETVTIAYQGAVSHRDSGGNSGTIFPGDVQWMSAASGVVHEEQHESAFAKAGGIFEMVQLWVNLPKAVKMSQPRYQGITSDQIPVVKLASGSHARIIAGDWNGLKGPAHTVTPLNVFDLRLKALDQIDFGLPSGHNSAVVLLKGDLQINSKEPLSGEARIAILSASGERVSLAASTDSVVLILSGEPIHEPIVSYGPFVMNTEAEIAQAMQDYRAGKMGRLHA